jgi:hypothetical protein
MGILFEAGVDVEVAKTILRHRDSSVTRRHSLILKSAKDGKAAMKKLERTLFVTAQERPGVAHVWPSGTRGKTGNRTKRA